jgi:hypothetical protein
MEILRTDKQRLSPEVSTSLVGGESCESIHPAVVPLVVQRKDVSMHACNMQGGHASIITLPKLKHVKA